MSTEIYYFSGTGNSLVIARDSGELVKEPKYQNLYRLNPYCKGPFPNGNLKIIHQNNYLFKGKSLTAK
jgi:hypothetical protein